MQQAKSPKESYTIMTEMVMPNDTNVLNNLLGGRLMHWMDIVAAISAQKHSNRVVVTASVDNISFKRPIRLGNVVTLQAQVSRAFTSSMEVYIQVHAEDIPRGEKFLSNEAFLTFVAVDQLGKPIQVPEITPETEEEIKRYDEAGKRRQVRLFLSGKLKIDNNDELVAFLESVKKKA